MLRAPMGNVTEQFRPGRGRHGGRWSALLLVWCHGTTRLHTELGDHGLDCLGQLRAID
jgi:hypothetical protein